MKKKLLVFKKNFKEGSIEKKFVVKKINSTR